MERAIAVKRLAKILGKKFGYQIDQDAPSAEQRAAARAASLEAHAERDKAAEAMKKRREELLAADSEYVRRLAIYNDLVERVRKLNGIQYRHKICVGRQESMFFHVDAQGDSWEEIFAILAKKNVAA